VLVSQLLVHGDELIMAGAGPEVVAWDGRRSRTLAHMGGGGPSFFPEVVGAMIDNDDLVLAGSFSSIDGQVANMVARATLLHCCGSPDFDADGAPGTDQDIQAFFACLSGYCCPTCGSVDFNSDGDVGTDADIEAFFRVLAGGSC
jgi:hypothetical protein